MKEKPNVDVIIPNYNKSAYIEEAINSVVKQTYKNWHLYVIDDCSTDNSLEKIKKFLEKKNIKIISLKKNKGPSFARNYGMRISNSKYISFLDSDDGWDIHKLEPLTNINLSEIIYIKFLNMGLPSNILLRELFGFILVFGYFLILPPLLAKTIFKRLYHKLGNFGFGKFDPILSSREILKYKRNSIFGLLGKNVKDETMQLYYGV